MHEGLPSSEQPVWIGASVVLHGFLGKPSDWDQLGSAVSRFGWRGSWLTHDLWNDLARLRDHRSPTSDFFSSWVSHFRQQVLPQYVNSVSRFGSAIGGGCLAQENRPEGGPEGGVAAGAERPLLIGYSMGGRLAMHLALALPQAFRGLVVVSAHPGLHGERWRRERLVHDQMWARRFETDSWEKVLADWEAQPVFSVYPPHFQRRERDFDRELLALALTEWSLGKQRDLRHGLSSLDLPILFVTGEHDRKFTEIMKQLKLNCRQKHIVVSRAGHRVPWDSPDGFLGAVADFATRSSLEDQGEPTHTWPLG